VSTTDPIHAAHTAWADTARADAPAIDSLAFDDALAELQRTVSELEAGGQPLEAAIALYERGVALQARCERLITDAELRVQQLVARAGGALETREVRTNEDGEAAPA
jgi:exodeoxyribonuclease VII small subunit